MANSPNSARSERASRCIASLYERRVTAEAAGGAVPSTITRPCACRCMGNTMARTAHTQHSTASAMRASARGAIALAPDEGCHQRRHQRGHQRRHQSASGRGAFALAGAPGAPSWASVAPSWAHGALSLPVFDVPLFTFTPPGTSSKSSDGWHTKQSIRPTISSTFCIPTKHVIGPSESSSGEQRSCWRCSLACGER